jgi:hypothetical protein
VDGFGVGNPWALAVPTHASTVIHVEIRKRVWLLTDCPPTYHYLITPLYGAVSSGPGVRSIQTRPERLVPIHLLSGCGIRDVGFVTEFDLGYIPIIPIEWPDEIAPVQLSLLKSPFLLKQWNLHSRGV